MSRKNKHGVVAPKCKFENKEDCTDPNCPVHGEQSKTPSDDDLTPSAAAAAPGTLCVSSEADIVCGQPREAHTFGAAKGDVGLDHEFEATREPSAEDLDAVAADQKAADQTGGEKGAAALDAAEAEAAKVAEAAVEVPLSDEAVRGILAEDVAQVLRDARELIVHMRHPNEFTQTLVERIDELLK